MNPSTGTAVRNHRNAVRNQSESLSAIAGIRNLVDLLLTRRSAQLMQPDHQVAARLLSYHHGSVLP